MLAAGEAPFSCTSPRARNTTFNNVFEPALPPNDVTKPSVLQTFVWYSVKGGVSADAPFITYEQCRIANQSTDEAKKMTFYRDYRNLRAYLPNNEFLLLKATGLQGDPASATWIDPRTGTTDPAAAARWLKCNGAGQTQCSYNATYCAANPSSCSYCGTLATAPLACGTSGSDPYGSFVCAFRNPLPTTTPVGSNDMVLRLTLLPSYSLGWAGLSARTAGADVGRLGENDEIGVDVSIFEENGERVEYGIRVSDKSAMEPAMTATGRDGAGDFAAVWQDDQDGDGNREIYLRWVTGSGSLVNDPVLVSLDPGSDNEKPAVALDSAGEALVVWKRRSAAGHEIVATVLEKHQESNDDEEVLASSASGVPLDWPLAASSPEGVFTVAWVEGPIARAGRPSIAAVVLPQGLGSKSEKLWITHQTADLLRPTLAYSAANGLVSIEWEAFGGEGGERLVRAVIDPSSESLVGGEALLASHGDDGPPPAVESESWEPLWGP